MRHPLQKRRSVFFNQSHCLLIVFTFANNAMLKLKRMYIVHIHTSVRMSSTAADSSQHASPQPGKAHILGYVWVSLSLTTKNNSRARARLIRHCHARQSIVPFITSTGITIGCYEIGERDFHAFFWRMSDDSNAKKL